ncbi:MAG: cupredoxin domain-containing protein [Thermodesulfobacteriota bacterium]
MLIEAKKTARTLAFLTALTVAVMFGWHSAASLVGDDTAQAAPRLTGKLDKKTNTRTIKVISDQWFFKPSTWRVKAGEKVVLKIDARASEMPIIDTTALSFPDFNWRMDVKTFTKHTIELPAKITAKPGEYFFECDIFCGPDHPDMNGFLIVVE